MVGLAWTPKLVQLETQDADAGQLVSFGLDRPNQRDAAAEADVNAHTSRHDHCCFFAFLVPHRTAGKPQKAVGRHFWPTTQHDTTQLIMPCYLPDWTATLTKNPRLGGPNSRTKLSAQPAIGSKVHGQRGSQLESSPRLVSHSECQCGEAKAAVMPSRRPSQLCSAATERYLQASQVGTRTKTRDESRPKPPPGPGSILAPSDAHARHMDFIRPRQFTRPPQSTRPHAHGLRRPRLRIMIDSHIYVPALSSRHSGSSCASHC